MEIYFECELETAGYRLRVTVCPPNPNEIEALAKWQAVQRLKQIHGVERDVDQFKIISIKNKRL